jgi:hypothetical protein
MSSTRRNTLLAVVFSSLLWPFTLIAQPAPSTVKNTAPAKPPVIAMLSLIGDGLNIVGKQSRTGTNLDPSVRRKIDIDSPFFDQQAMNASIKGLRKVMPNAEFAVLNSRSEVLFEKQRTLFEKDGRSIKIPSPILDAAKQQGATHLLLILKAGKDSDFQFADGFIADGARLEGLGFYIDKSVETFIRKADGQRVSGGVGFVAPFIVINLILVELPSLNIIGERPVTAFEVLPHGIEGDQSPTSWVNMDSARRTKFISDLIGTDVSGAAEKLLSQRLHSPK